MKWAFYFSANDIEMTAPEDTHLYPDHCGMLVTR